MYLPSDPKVWEEARKDKLIRKPQFWLPMLGGLLIVLSTPGDVFQQFPFLEQLTMVIANNIPSIDTWVERSSHPATTRLLLSYCWVLVPYYAYLMHKHYYNDSVSDRKLQLWSKLGWKRHFIPLQFSIIFAPITAIFYFFALPEEPHCTHLCIHESLILQLLITFCFILSISFFFSFVYFWLKIFNKFHFLKDFNGDN